MKRLRVERWTNQLLTARSGAAGGISCSAPRIRCLAAAARKSLSTAAAESSAPVIDGLDNNPRFPPLEDIPPQAATLPSPLPERALQSAKLAALHARLSLSQKIPLQTLARTLVDASADSHPRFNNTNLAFVGQTLINYHVAEQFMIQYPRLPMEILYAAIKGIAGDTSLYHIAKSWGIESAAAPGGEVDPGFLQYSLENDGDAILFFGSVRTEAKYLDKYKFRRGVSSRVVFDNDFGDRVDEFAQNIEDDEGASGDYGSAATRKRAEKAHANHVRAVVGAIYAHCGRDAVKAFVKAHVLSRKLALDKLFYFSDPTRELATLCAREDFEKPIARLLSETGRLSRTPVFVVGIYSGKDKLGEASAPSLDHARRKAAMNALKAWYLYSPGENARVPSDMLAEDAEKWEPGYIDIGEIITRGGNFRH
ncbi:ribonuclease III domain-containing protein [Podospora fimiseda]|uniref:Large ribosomal subunit protein mL44 n=1 Tax=Podospora fimiseda TaxID=252190 RepID=A0AAN7H3S0_9PEZI|nr:ribonuclease III domain-containing protein [Podospora fimiseda]